MFPGSISAILRTTTVKHNMEHGNRSGTADETTVRRLLSWVMSVRQTVLETDMKLIFAVMNNT